MSIYYKPYSENFPDDTERSYDRDGLVVAVSNSFGVVSNEYNEISWLTNTRGVDGSEVAYTHRPAGQIETVTTVAGTTAYGLNEADKLAHIASGSQFYGYSYNPWNGLIASVTNANGIAVNYSYDVMNRITNIVWSIGSGTAAGGGTLADFGYGYNAAGMITDHSRNVGSDSVSVAYGYDGLDRLASETESYGIGGNITRTYAYDLAGNRLRKTETGAGAVSYTLGIGNRLATFGGNSYLYDAAGCVTNMVKDGVNVSLTWDAKYQLSSVSTNGVIAESYTYDGLGRRVSTTTGGVTLRHIYDGAHCVADVDANGTVLKSYTYGPGIDNLLAVNVHSGNSVATYYALTDIQGTVHGFADASGNLVARYVYDAWGRMVSASNNLPALADNRFLFQGREYSWATGLYNFRARWYDAETGRWLSNDPIGISGGPNMYEFCGNDPVNYRDPSGLCKENEGDGLSGIEPLIAGFAKGQNNPSSVFDGITDPGKAKAAAEKAWSDPIRQGQELKKWSKSNNLRNSSLSRGGGGPKMRGGGRMGAIGLLFFATDILADRIERNGGVDSINVGGGGGFGGGGGGGGGGGFGRMGGIPLFNVGTSDYLRY